MFNQLFNKRKMKDKKEKHQDEEQLAQNDEPTEETPQVVENEEIEALQEQVNDLKDKYLRLFAEFDNYKKRTSQERLELMKTAARDTVSSLLPVLDDFDRAKKAAENPATGEVFTDGIALVYHKLYNILQNQGLTPMESTGQQFNPEMHEAITEIPAPTPDLKGKVVDTVETGYLLNDKIIRYAKVVVGR